ncbi:NAD-dependent protein deacetylase-like isoform X2 [Dysidea avara]|uniref:NAD-dependent protein deacetylase-like isoform X2 n=1 Tax=Dysidea avara TaxID=196820 RepID=UPI003319414F
MAHTARSKKETKEFFDPPEELNRKVDQLAELGAGISTSTGIPDFRSGMDTKLETGPGKWELQAHSQSKGATAHKAGKTTSTVKAIPSPTHMLLVKLQQEGILKHIISQNTDGLHRRSGIPQKALWELHGNNNMEWCKKCKHEYLRDFKCSRPKSKHITGRNCDNPACGGQLRDTIINFGESLPQDALDGGFEQASLADLCVVFGSSLTVTPAADMPLEVVKKKNSPGDLVIINLQETPLDVIASLRIFSKCDDVSKLLAEKLSVEIPPFRLRRRLLVTTAPTGKGQRVEVMGTDIEGSPFSYLKQVQFNASDVVSHHETEPAWLIHRGGSMVKITLHFQGHYYEPQLTINFMSNKGERVHKEYLLEYDPHNCQWSTNETGDGLAAQLEKQAKISS